MTVKEKLKNSEKVWAIRQDLIPCEEEDVKTLARELDISYTYARLLATRGCRTPEEARKFLHFEEEVLHDPFLLTDMEKAVDIILDTIKAKRAVMIYGDYDVDGVTSVSLLYLYLKELGADVDYYIPNRAGEGYGMSVSAIEKMANDGVGLIITVDTGITAKEETEAAQRLGIKVIVTDHHECHRELPPTDATVNPKRADCAYPHKNLAGVGVVFKLVCAIETTRRGRDRAMEATRDICLKYADFVALGTIADVMPVIDENRLIVYYGLSLIEKRTRLGISALINSAVQKNDTCASFSRKIKPPRITSGFVGYTLAPRINAAGRITNASAAVELFLTNDAERADALAANLCEINRFRQSEENKIACEAYERITSEHDFENDPVIVLEDDNWHHGVIGIVASRITEKYGLPSILISFEGVDADGSGSDIGKGSGRSIRGLNLVDALVYCNDLLQKYGGHELAAGMCIERRNIDAFKKRINEYARSAFSEQGMSPNTLDYDFEIKGEELTLSLAEELRLLEPHGTANPLPSFVMKDCKIIDIVPVSGGKHTKLIIENGDHSVVAMCFSSSQAELNLFSGERADILFNIDINEYNGIRTVQLIVKDIKKSESFALEREKEAERYNEIKNGAIILSGEDVVPNREDFSNVFTLLRREIRMGCSEISHRALMAKLDECRTPINYIKLKFIIMVLRELNIMGIDELTDEYYSIKLNYTNVKSDLEKSNILRKLRGQLHRQASD